LINEYIASQISQNQYVKYISNKQKTNKMKNKLFLSLFGIMLSVAVLSAQTPATTKTTKEAPKTEAKCCKAGEKCSKNAKTCDKCCKDKKAGDKKACDKK